MSEVGERAIAQFMVELMLDGSKVESEDENAGDDADRTKKVKVVMKDIDSAAGGDLLQGLATVQIQPVGQVQSSIVEEVESTKKKKKKHGKKQHKGRYKAEGFVWEEQFKCK
ncbi:uncharacterized protein LAESUDRAFT_762336 [Laetiporus sulphureus 93-53]|uniref:Uncharacterized protein n=1 Tax=Laetiporus sulphureus 93-53 TaxID=1314785 RepID=A0A165CJ68_9APHY|nr:uncharacterized protein LAESUDRAFT_762336 [Laetiporus sulphureus 93-53]KZT02906.1 hypothetical protein LAESUDRAFT_762336 [Laetiporus sulphureus 93-53]